MRACLALLLTAHALAAAEPPPVVRVGSKKFTEAVILAEMACALVRDAGGQAQHLRELGSTQILWNALQEGDIDLYPEYTGTLRELLPDEPDLVSALARRGLRISRPLGFNNSYALGMRADVARRLGIQKLSDLRDHPGLRYGLTEEFRGRRDGWEPLRRHYRLPVPDSQVRTLDHDLAYRGLMHGDLDVVDLYTTDGEIRQYNLVVLADDDRFFPAYDAVLLYRADLRTRLLPRLPPHHLTLSSLLVSSGSSVLPALPGLFVEEEQLTPPALASVLRLEGKISEAEMIEMNSQASVRGVRESHIAAGFLREHLGVVVPVEEESLPAYLLRLTGEHLLLVLLSLAAAVLIGLPLGILAAKRERLGQAVLATVSVLQTVPSLALLAFLIPLLGIGAKPALAALFLYSLLPIVRNTYVGLREVPAHLRESAAALGLPPLAVLRRVELPLAARTILAGIKTAAVINVGTATLGALIGAGGYGQPIFSGIRLNNYWLILQGAVPAALLALAVQGLFEIAERTLTPRGLRLPASGAA